MILWYDSDRFLEAGVKLSQIESDHLEEMIDELALGFSILLIRAMQATFPCYERSLLFAELVFDKMNENLSEWQHGVFEV